MFDFMLVFLGLAFIGASFIVWPLLRLGRPLVTFFIGLTSFVFPLCCYLLTHHLDQLKDYWFRQAHPQMIEQTSEALKKPNLIIYRFHQYLLTHPDDDRGWYLLGRLYLGQGKSVKAQEAFRKALHIRPKFFKYQLSDLEADFIKHNGQLTKPSRQLALTLLNLYPDHILLLNWLALDAYQRQDFKHAIDYWEHLLSKLPASSQSSKAVVKALVKAHKKQFKKNQMRGGQLFSKSHQISDHSS